MPKLKIAVCMKIVPKPEEIHVDTTTGWLKRESVRSEINPPDMNAMEMALRLKDKHSAKVYILSMGPLFFADYLKIPLSMGANHIFLLSDKRFAGADTLATTYTLAQAIKKMGEIDIILCGEESSDGATGQVPPGIAEWLDYNQLTMANQVDIDIPNKLVRGQRDISSGYEIIQVPIPVVISIRTASNEPRFMNYENKKWAFEDSRITIWNKDDLKADAELIGENGSPTSVSKLIQAPEKIRKRIFLEGTTNEVVKKLTNIIFESLDINGIN
jgi:electron transfer flavoprotein beta subunit